MCVASEHIKTKISFYPKHSNLNLGIRGQSFYFIYDIHPPSGGRCYAYKMHPPPYHHVPIFILESVHLTEIRERIQQSGMRTGFATLFYGVSGTRRMKTVYTKRDIMTVILPKPHQKIEGRGNLMTRHDLIKFVSYVIYKTLLQRKHNKRQTSDKNRDRAIITFVIPT